MEPGQQYLNRFIAGLSVLFMVFMVWSLMACSPAIEGEGTTADPVISSGDSVAELTTQSQQFPSVAENSCEPEAALTYLCGLMNAEDMTPALSFRKQNKKTLHET